MPSPGNPQALNRYSYTLNNPLKYTDPTGHFWWIVGGAAVGAVIAYGAQVVGNLNQDMNLGAALTTNINGAAIVAGAMTGAAVVAMAPVAVTMVGEALMGAGLLTGSAGLFTAGTTVAGTGATLGGIIYGVSTASQKAQYVYDARCQRYRDTSTGRFVAESDLPWPPNEGFARTPVQGTVPSGVVIDRYGSERGRNAGMPGATVSQRGLPPGSEARPYNQYEVVKPIANTKIGVAAPVPAFAASGGGVQLKFPQPIGSLVRQGYLKPQ